YSGVGNPFVTRAPTPALRRRGYGARAIMPGFPGCDPAPLDAEALARSSGDLALARAAGLPRFRAPVAPYAALRAGEGGLRFDDLAQATRRAMDPADIALIEGAGGILVPLTRQHDILDLARALGAPLLLVAADRLGVLSASLTAAAAAATRGWPARGLVLVDHGDTDPSKALNAAILSERLTFSVLTVPPCPDDDARLSAAVETSGLVDLALALLSPPPEGPSPP
ncbi:MAG: dethiobiotin synthase, partial [Sandaracinaceae bacterium]